MNTKMISFRLPSQMLRLIGQLAWVSRRSKAYVIRELLAQAIDAERIKQLNREETK